MGLENELNYFCDFCEKEIERKPEESSTYVFGVLRMCPVCHFEKYKITVEERIAKEDADVLAKLNANTLSL